MTLPKADTRTAFNAKHNRLPKKGVVVQHHEHLDQHAGHSRERGAILKVEQAAGRRDGERPDACASADYQNAIRPRVAPIRQAQLGV